MSRLWEPRYEDATTSLGTLGPAVSARLAKMAADRVVTRIFERDHTVWKPEPTEISDRLGWLTVASEMREKIVELHRFARQAADDGFTRAVLLGMGGSSLAPEVLRRTLGVGPGALDLIVLDTTHPARVRAVESRLDLDTTLFVVASKSGGTIETLSHMEYFWRQATPAQFVAITDPGTPLESAARERGFRHVFLNPADIGGRYSALSYFGLVPAALIGADLESLIDGAENLEAICRTNDDNPASRLGAILGEAALAGRDKLTLVFPREIESFGAWIEQLVAESTGKEGRGILPVDGEPLGEPKVYGDDRLFIASGIEHDAHLDHLHDDGQPIVRLRATTATLGADFFMWELATAVAGHVLGINPFDQPNVAEAKEATAKILQEASTHDDEGFGDLRALLAQTKPGTYVAIQAFIDPTPENHRVLHDARAAIRDRYGVATTVGFGPRYLHSTGQLHKGGPPTGVFIQVVDAERENDVAIPGKPYTFGALIDAQAAGDLRSLRARGRRVVRVTPYHLEEVH